MNDQPDNRVGVWSHPAVIAPNNFVHESLSCWSYNIAVGCSHACRFCYVPDTTTIKMGPQLAKHGVTDPDEEWGNYLLLRPWDEKRFLVSLRAAKKIPREKLNLDGNRAVMLCTTTDPYQVIHHRDPIRQRELAKNARELVRRALELIRDDSTLNVRILTRSPLARLDFDIYQTFGHRLIFGMSLPTLRNDLSKIYEPKAPAPTQRLATLKAAKEAGLHVYVAMAPTYPECDEEDLRATMTAIKDLDPLTLFHEPINLRADNVLRIAKAAATAGLTMQTEVFQSPQTWQNYALGALRSVWRLSGELSLREKLHLWPDKTLGSKSVVASARHPAAYTKWLHARWSRISEWPE